MEIIGLAATGRSLQARTASAGTAGAYYLRMSKKNLVEAAVEFYLNARREEVQAGMRELLGQLDGAERAYRSIRHADARVQRGLLPQ